MLLRPPLEKVRSIMNEKLSMRGALLMAGRGLVELFLAHFCRNFVFYIRCLFFVSQVRLCFVSGWICTFHRDCRHDNVL